MDFEAYKKLTSFNSLQTGKRIQRSKNQDGNIPNQEKFQFPSNGKAYPKPANDNDEDATANNSFNSLQTGKRIQRM